MKKKPKPKSIKDEPSMVAMNRDTEALKHLADLEEIVSVPPERGGIYFSNWEREFIRSVREQFDKTLEFSSAQRAKIRELWQAIDLRKRPPPVSEKPSNLFSKLSPERQAEQRRAAEKVKLPWEK